MRQATPDTREYIRAFYRKNKLNFIGSLVLLLLTVSTMLVISWLLGEVLDVITAGDLDRLLRLLLHVVIPVILLDLLVNAAAFRLKSRFIHRGLAQYRSLAYSRLSQKSISAFSKESTGQYLSALTNDTNSIEENYLNGSILLVYYCVMFVSTLVMMFWYSWPLALAALALTALPIAVSLLMGGELSRREQQVSDRNAGFVSLVKDLLAGFPVIKGFKAERQMEALFDKANQDAEQTKLRRRWWSSLLSCLSQSCGTVVQLGIFFFGAWLAIRGSITGGAVLIMVNLCNFILQPIYNIPSSWANRKAARALIQKLADAVRENAVRSGKAIPPQLSDAITLDHLTFSYEPGQPVLKDLTLRFEAGKKYAVVGGSGSGKSTLLNLLMGACSTYEGSIAIDGVPLRDIDTDSLYELASLISQNVFLFNDTLQNNITMFQRFPAEQVEEAVKRSGLSNIVAERGMDYPCGENGVDLSGGERQRVSIARCLLRGTPVLLLDEATAALDNQTAFAVTDAILHLDGLTRVVVTHRLDKALMEQYDAIFVLRGGQLQEQGTYAQLMEKKGYFYSLYTLSA